MSFDLNPSHLRDSLINIVPLKEADFEKLYLVASDPLIWEQNPSNDRYKKDVFQTFFEGAVKSQSAFLIYDTKTNALIGSTRYYDYDPEKSVVCIGYTFLARAYWGGQYNLAMKKLLMDYAFHFVNEIVFHIGAKNKRSQKALKKLGGTKINEIEIDHQGKKIPYFTYNILKKDWDDFKRNQIKIHLEV